jgi:hypothetical protein
MYEAPLRIVTSNTATVSGREHNNSAQLGSCSDYSCYYDLMLLSYGL